MLGLYGSSILAGLLGVFLAAGAVAVAGGFEKPHARGADAAPKFKLGTVTYNVPANWDLPTLLKVCKGTGISAVECRTTHKHGLP